MDNDRFPVAGIGASAGGLEALSELLSALRAEANAAYIVVQHLNPEHKSLLSELLAKKTNIPVVEVRQGQVIEPAHIYVIPPNALLRVSGNAFELSPRIRDGHPHHPVDVLFTSLANAWGPSAIGVVLSGGDADGSVGIQAIKHSGGITFAQTPESAQVASMPRNAIDTGCVDFVMDPRAIANEIGRLLAHPYLRERDGPRVEAPQMQQDEEAALRRIFHRLRSSHGVDFAHYKRSTLLRRLARRMAVRRASGLGDYTAMLEQDPAETAALYQDFLIRVTGFFRDPDSFESLRERVFPVLTEGRSNKDPLRIWVPGCATGEEAYSIAIALVDYLGDRTTSPRIQIFGTDVSESAIEKARSARYSEATAEEIPPALLNRFFTKDDGHYHIVKSIRDLCIFARQDVTRDPPFSRLDLVSCRNLLIYLDAAAQRRVMHVFHYSLRPHAFLMLGPSESVGVASDLFDLLDKQQRIYLRKGSADTTTSAELDEIHPARLTYPKMDQPPAASRASPENDADRILLARYAPASILVDEDLNIIQFRGETAPYLEHASGPSSLNLRRVARPELLVELSPAIDKARDTEQAVRLEGLSVAESADVSAEVIPLIVSSIERAYLVIFEDASRRSRRPQPTFRSLPESEKDRRLAQLEREIMASREYLQATLEHHAAVKEELKSAHEEVLSANEEFQSTNEELETAKEELQSSNEELVTTNDELRARNSELAVLNSSLRKARNSAERSRAYAEAIISSVRQPLVVLDVKLRILRASPSFYKALRLKPDDAQGQTIETIGLVQWNLPDFLQQLKDVLSHNVAVNDYEILHQQAGESTPRVFLANARKIFGDDDRDALILLSIEDVTERVSTANDLRKSNRRKDEFLAMLAHELRNPLTPITHAIHLLQRGSPHESTAHLHDLISRQTRRLVRLVDDLLDVARISRGHIEIRADPVDLGAITRDASEAARTRIEANGQELRVDLPVREVCVIGDGVRLEQVVANLLDNASKYTPSPGRIEVSLESESGWAALHVRDNGIGVAAEDLGVIFDLFAQVDKSLARSASGLGIGLTLVRRVLELLGGRIEARSAGLGHGTEFVVRLPLTTQRAHIKPARVETPATERRRLRVLIVDDNTDVADSIALLVSSMGHETAVAYDGASALEVAARFDPQRALIDIGLPDISGFALASRIHAAHPECGLIALSGYGTNADKAAARNAGFDKHLSKPARPEDIEDALEHLA